MEIERDRDNTTTGGNARSADYHRLFQAMGVATSYEETSQCPRFDSRLHDVEQLLGASDTATYLARVGQFLRVIGHLLEDVGAAKSPLCQSEQNNPSKGDLTLKMTRTSSCRTHRGEILKKQHTTAQRGAKYGRAADNHEQSSEQPPAPPSSSTATRGNQQERA